MTGWVPVRMGAEERWYEVVGFIEGVNTGPPSIRRICDLCSYQDVMVWQNP
jgi:hypothetical protein